ncbi:2Fe-2S iron-sulfur cluster-binding protein [Streptomyces niveiscabiei]|uniref:2Fe-2S iron-sulfur cluster-binding protein n=1 Tax=Streptomyces niveiscabiei TaxID=164115 RepID=A0ABW9HS24_9ACTN
MTDEQHSQEHGTPQGVSRWDPLPQGDYDDGATAFVKLPEGGVDALLARDSPLAAPGHGYVPPPITPEPWAAPADGAEWPAPTVSGSGDDRFTYPAQQHTGQWTYEEPPPAAPAHDVTGQWSIPVAGGDLPDESGEFTASALVEQWGAPQVPGWTDTGWEQHGQGGAGHSDGRGVELPGLSGYSDGRGTDFTVAGGHAEGHGVGYPEVPEQSEGRGADLAGGPAGGLGAAEFGHAGETDGGAGASAELDGGAGAGFGGAAGLDGLDGLDGRGAAGSGESVGAGGAGGVAGSGEVVGHAPAEADGGAAGGHAVAESGAAAAAINRLTLGAGQRLVPEGEAASEGGAVAEAGAGPEAGVVAEGEKGAGAPEDVSVEAAVEPAYEAPSGPVEGVEGASEGAEGGPGAPEGSEAPGEAQEGAGVDEAGETGEVPLPPGEEHPLASYVLSVNGTDRPVTDAWIGESLLYVLRERLGLAGAKDGCSQGECGACNVQVDGRLVASCLVPAVTTAGSEVRTVEGLAEDGHPSDVQRALARCGAVQCGFCVPGMAMTVHDLLEGNPAPTELEARQALCGNLCRCSGYRGVLDAVQEVVQEREAIAAAEAETDGDGARIPHQAGPGSGGAHPSVFDTGTLGGQGQVFGQDGGQA